MSKFKKNVMKISKFIASLIALLIISCDNDVNVDFPDFPNFPPNSTNCLAGQGAIVSETRTITDDFNSINSFIFGDIFITQGPKEDIRIEGQQNIIDQINTDVVNGELRLTLDRCVSIGQAVKVYVVVPEIESLTLLGVGDIIAQNDFDLSELNITLTGTGDIRLRGNSSNLDILLTGVGDVKAFEMTSDICEVRISGVGDTEVSVNDELNVTITGTGDLYYKGNPTITSTITGSGTIIDAN